MKERNKKTRGLLILYCQHSKKVVMTPLKYETKVQQFIMHGMMVFSAYFDTLNTTLCGTPASALFLEKYLNHTSCHWKLCEQMAVLTSDDASCVLHILAIV